MRVCVCEHVGSVKLWCSSKSFDHECAPPPILLRPTKGQVLRGICVLLSVMPVAHVGGHMHVHS